MQHKRVAIYSRYSTDMQNPKSTEDQIRECRAHAEREGWKVVEVLQDRGISGTTTERPGYQALLASVRTKAVDIVLVENIDRLGRDTEHMAAFYKAATHADVEIHQLGKGKLGFLDIGIMGTLAAMYLEDLAHKTRRGLAGRIEQGKSAGGLSYGYRRPLDERGDTITGELEIDENQASIITRIFTEYADGQSPLQIAANLNADKIPAPRGRGEGSGHWKQNTINGNRERGTGILNNELYQGRRVWNRLRYSKHPDTGRRVSRPNPPTDWKIQEVPDLRIVGEDLWNAVKARQEMLSKQRGKRTANDKNGLSASQRLRRRKYLLSGLLICGQCGGKLTVAGSGKARRYYCANAKEKGDAVCSGMPGLREDQAAEKILGNLRSALMQDAAYQKFRSRYEEQFRATEHQRGDAMRLFDQETTQLEQEHANLLRAVKNGLHSDAIISELNAVDAKLTQRQVEREALVPTPIELPEDLPALYRDFVANITDTLSEEGVAGRASEELHALLDQVIISWDADARCHEFEIRGDLLELIGKPQGETLGGDADMESSLKLVAGVGFEPTTFRL